MYELYGNCVHRWSSRKNFKSLDRLLSPRFSLLDQISSNDISPAPTFQKSKISKDTLLRSQEYNTYVIIEV